ncbi:MAG: hypothetical protein ACRDZM_13225 [Acidimicrobiia bacterium]
MSNDEPAVETMRVKKGARPWSGFFLGLILGIAVAVVLQQAGIWPLDRLLLFGSAGLFGLAGILIGGAGREKVSAFSSILPLILAVALLAFGATGLTAVNENGELNGGCAVEATSDVDTTQVTDSSRRDPFDIDPEGSLSWVATSPGPIMDNVWEIYVDVGGFSVPVAGNDEPDPNTEGNQENSGEVTDVSSYVEEVTDFTGVELRGVFLVGGQIEGDGGACDGFGFVRLTADPLGTLIAQIAAGVGVLALLGLLIVAFNRTREAEVVVDDRFDEDDSYAEVGGGAAGAAGSRIAEEGQADTASGIGAHERKDHTDDNVSDGEHGEGEGVRDDM